ncbi:MAG: glycosyltransferase family 4 protein [Planctomycetes bacterium]|nr:glycosyltransferase family 4 protein [Planctomycetota bacterium]
MPSILVLCEYPSLNGGERSLLAALEHETREECGIQVAAPATGPLAESLRSLRIRHIPLDLHDGNGRRLALDECRQRLRRIIQATRPDVIHANSLSMSRLSGPLTAELDVPGLGHLRDIIRVNRRVIDDLNCHARLLAVSEATRRWFTDLGVDGPRVHVMYNGVDLQRFRPRRPTGYLHRELRLPLDAPLIGAIGQVGIRKGLDVLLAAAGAIVEQHPSAQIVIVGQRYSQKHEATDYESRLLAAASTPPLLGRVHFLGLRDDVSEILSEVTLLVHAARQEPLGRVLLEAAAVGVPVVATSVGGTPEIFRSPDEAILLPPGDPVRLATAVQRLLGDPAARKKLSLAARRRAETTFSVEAASQSLLRHYRSVGRLKGGVAAG